MEMLNIVLLEDNVEILAAFTDKIKAKDYANKYNKKFGTNFKCSVYIELNPVFKEAPNDEVGK